MEKRKKSFLKLNFQAVSKEETKITLNKTNISKHQISFIKRENLKTLFLLTSCSELLQIIEILTLWFEDFEDKDSWKLVLMLIKRIKNKFDI